jgi:HlyD family secretion protein
MTVFRWIFALLVVSVVAMVALKNLRPPQEPPINVQTHKAEKTTVTRTVTAAGKLQPSTKVNVSSNITGVLIELKVGIGSVVKKGDVLAQIDTSRYQAQLEQSRSQVGAASADARRASANLARLRSEAARLQALVAKGAGNASDLEQARDQVRIGEAEVAAAESRADMARAARTEADKTLGWATIVSPVSGTVLSTGHLVGERVRGSDFAEDVILVIGTVGRMEVRIEVGEHDVVFVKPGQPATIEVDALPDHPLHGKVIDSGRDAIVKNAGTDNEVTTFPVWVTIDEPPPTVLSGMSAQVSISTESKADVVAVPIQAVTVRPVEVPGAPPSENQGIRTRAPLPPSMPGVLPKTKLEKVVFIMKDGVAHRRKVTTGLSSESMIEIVEGLAPGEEVIEGPYRVLARQIMEGSKVKVGMEPMK